LPYTCPTARLARVVAKRFARCHSPRREKCSLELRDIAQINKNQITFPGIGATITAIASEYAGTAGSNLTCVCFDELWGYRSEAGQRMWDEMVPVPTRKVSVRLTVTYAGYSGESKTLEALYARGLKGAPIAPNLYRQRVDSRSHLRSWKIDSRKRLASTRFSVARKAPPEPRACQGWRRSRTATG
jgi:hypothetical protein